MVSVSQLEKKSLQLTAFLIPSNLSYHWITDQAYVAGKLVDYLIPKLYLSDIPIIVMLCIWLLKSKKKIDIKKLSKYSVLTTCYLLLATRCFFTPHPLAALWFHLKLIEFGLLIWYIHTHYTRSSLLSTLKTPLFISAWIQIVIAITQFIKQKSVFGYLFMGESMLTTASNVAKVSLGGIIKILPYGTTSHPNVLAGFLVLSMLMLLLCMQKRAVWRAKNGLVLLTIGLSLGIILLTNSVSALAAILTSLLLLYLPSEISKVIQRLIICLLVSSSVMLTLIVPFNLQHLSDLFDKPSINRRYELINIAKRQLLSRQFLVGIGLNQFTASMVLYPPVTAETAFLQPVHNVYILWLTETGLAGLLLLALALTRLFSRMNKLAAPQYALPLLCLLLIGFLDHYPLTLQTGQLLTAISLALITLKTA